MLLCGNELHAGPVRVKQIVRVLAVRSRPSCEHPDMQLQPACKLANPQ